MSMVPLNDLKNKIDYYLAHPAERDIIRRAGFERTKHDHTYVSVVTIIETIYGNN